MMSQKEKRLGYRHKWSGDTNCHELQVRDGFARNKSKISAKYREFEFH